MCDLYVSVAVVHVHLTVRVQLSQQTLRVPLISTFLPTSSRQWSIRLDQNLKV